MLHLLLILSSLGPLTSAAPSSEMPLLYLTVPQRVGLNSSQDYPPKTHVTYFLKIEDKFHTLLLEKQSFLPPYFMVYSYNKSGTRSTFSPVIKDQCFYQGYSKEFPKSAVTLSICSGLRGLLQFENVSYGIEPLDSSANNEHIVFQTKNNKIGYPPFQKNHLTNQHVSSSYRILVKSEGISDTSLRKTTLKMKIIMDKAMYDVMGSEADLAAEKVIRIFSLINSMLSQFKITVMLSSLELWSDRNKISTNGDAEEILKRFLSWKKNDPFQSPHEMSYLFIYRDQATFVGTTYHGMACDPKFAAGVALYPNMATLEAFSVIVVQLLGINLGLTYDDIYNCYCPGPMCIMNPEAILSSGVKFFSSCSMVEFKQSVSLPKFDCLQSKEVPTVVLQGKSGTCGNGILEGTEQCDCGVGEACSHKKCCNPADCTLIGFSECGTGPCCDAKTCLIASRGKLCRKSTDPCDFPEFCNGTSEFCVPDVKSADLEPCNNKTAFCFQGRCRDRDKQCLGIFGEFAKSGTYLCEEELNYHNDKFGSCRRQCNYNFVLCGKLACRWTKAVLASSKEYDVQYIYISDQICVTASLRNSSRQDDTFVEPGSVCGEQKICLNGECKLLHAYPGKPNCDSRKLCQGHGVCNERLNCHCDAGYSPPNCDETPFSPGGSVDDGYWLPTSKSLYFPESYQGAPKKNGLLISFYIYLPLVVVIAVIALNWNRRKRFWHREETLSRGSVSEDSNSSSLQSQSKSH